VLYNLNDDIGELIDVSNSNPEVVKKLCAMADSIRADIGDKNIRGSNKRTPGYIEGYIMDPVNIDHLAKGKTYSIVHEFSPRYSGEGNTALTDGFLATSSFRDGYWQGYQGVDLLATIDLEEKMQIQEVSIGFFEGIPSWIFLPQKVKISVSNEGITFNNIAENNTFKADKNSGISRMNIQFDPVVTRYIRIFAESMGTCPPGHPGEGGKAWLFIDEIAVK
jgi:hexosaminidase